MLARLRRYDSVQWANDFLNQLSAVSRERSLYGQSLLDEARHEEMLQAYGRAGRRLLVLDYDGTLVPFSVRSENASPDAELKGVLRRLAADGKNSVVIMSGRSHEVLERWLDDVPVDLVAEHGARWRPVGEREWRLSPEVLQEDWRSSIRPLLEVYVNRTPGSYLEEKETSLVWHYRTAEPELGSQRAKELNDTLRSYVMNTPLHITQGAKFLEVKLSAVTRGRTLRRWLRRRPPYDFIMAMGEDVTDEGFFRMLPARAWSVKVGMSASLRARFFVRDHQQVRAILGDLAGAAGPDQ